MRYAEILFEGYKEAIADFSNEASKDQVNSIIDAFKKLVDRNQFKDNERNIDYWRKQGWDKFHDAVQKRLAKPSKTQVKRKKIVGTSITLEENDDWLIVIPLDKEASCFHGKDTDWCTTKSDQEHFEEYFYDKEIILIYLLNKHTGGRWAIAAHVDRPEVELFDKEDKDISIAEFKKQTGRSAIHLRAKAIREYNSQISDSRLEYKDSIKRIEEILQGSKEEVLSNREELEKLLLYTKSPILCKDYIYMFAHDNLNYPVAIQVAGVKTGGHIIQFLENPPEIVKVEAVKYNGGSIRYIKNPSEKVQMIAVISAGYALKYIEHPTHDVVLTAIEINPEAIAFVKDQTTELQLLALKVLFKKIGGKQNVAIFEHFKNPSEEVQLDGIEKFGWNSVVSFLPDITKISERVKMATILDSNNAAYPISLFVDHDVPLSNDLIFTAVKKSPSAIVYIKNPSEKLQLLAVGISPATIKLITRQGIVPSEQVQLTAVTKNFESISFIPHPTEKVKALAKQLKDEWDKNENK